MVIIKTLKQVTSSSGFNGGLSAISLESIPSADVFKGFWWCLGFGANGNLFWEKTIIHEADLLYEVSISNK